MLQQKGVPLSSDCFTGWSLEDSDAEKHNEEATKATKRLLTSGIESYIKHLQKHSDLDSMGMKSRESRDRERVREREESERRERRSWEKKEKRERQETVEETRGERNGRYRDK